MTVVLMGMLVDEGKLTWNDPVYTYLPERQLSDPGVTRQLTIPTPAWAFSSSALTTTPKGDTPWFIRRSTGLP